MGLWTCRDSMSSRGYRDLAREEAGHQCCPHIHSTPLASQRTSVLPSVRLRTMSMVTSGTSGTKSASSSSLLGTDESRAAGLGQSPSFLVLLPLSALAPQPPRGPLPTARSCATPSVCPHRAAPIMLPTARSCAATLSACSHHAAFHLVDLSLLLPPASLPLLTSAPGACDCVGSAPRADGCPAAGCPTAWPGWRQ